MRNRIQAGGVDIAGEDVGGPGSGWRLPSGEDLISFALGVGLAAGPLIQLPGEHQERSESIEEAEQAARQLGAGPSPELVPGMKG